MKYFLHDLVLAIFLVASCFATEQEVYARSAVVDRVIDGDTFDVTIDLGFDLSMKARVRLHGVDTPEKFGKTKEGGMAVKAYVAGLLTGESVTLYIHGKDSFGRWLAKVEVANSKVDIGQHLLDTGKAKAYGR